MSEEPVLKKKCFVFFGRPGCGKGTQSKRLAEKFGFPHISTGDLLRDEGRKGTSRGRLIKSLIDNHQYAPDDIMRAIILDRIMEEDCRNGYVLDGYPRNPPQLELFEREIAPDYVVILLNISDEEAAKRLPARLSCRCGRTYNGKTRPPKAEGICDFCGGKLFQREDEKTLEGILERLEIYGQKAEPLVGAFRERGVLIEIDGQQPEEKVHEDIIRALE